jgi:hypothetical protein
MEKIKIDKKVIANILMLNFKNISMNTQINKPNNPVVEKVKR